MNRSTRRTHRRLRRYVVGAVLVAFVGASLATLAIATDTFGAGERWISLVARVERLMAGPVPDRATLKTVRVTEPPEVEEPAEPTPVGSPSGGTTPSVEPVATPTPRPERKPMDVDIVEQPNRVFASQYHKDWCAPAGVQTVLAILGKSDIADGTQIEIAGKVRRWEAWDDSHNGAWGPAAMALALDEYGAPGYEVRAFEHMTYALRDAAVAIQSTQSPAILLAWRGAHTWVMSGYRADGDPAIFRNTKIEGAYILDPWYPRVSSIWGASNPPGTFTEFEELRENFLPWKRPEGRYPDRDGLYITVVPTIPRAEAG